REWRTLLQRIGPDEVHLVLPAGSRTDVALATRDAYVACGTTHLLLTKLDEVPGEDGVAELADALNLPARWVATGQDVAADLEPAAQRLIASLCGGAAPDRAVGGTRSSTRSAASAPAARRPAARTTTSPSSSSRAGRAVAARRASPHSSRCARPAPGTVRSWSTRSTGSARSGSSSARSRGPGSGRCEEGRRTWER